MKIIKFLSRFTLICNVCFLIFAVANLIQTETSGLQTKAIPDIPILKEVIITLGMFAIFINTILCLIYCILLVKGSMKKMKIWLPVTNFIFLLVQFYFFFLLKTNG